MFSLNVLSKANPFNLNYKATALFLQIFLCISNHINNLAQVCKNGYYVEKLRTTNVEIYINFDMSLLFV